MGFCMRASWEAQDLLPNDTGEKNAGDFLQKFIGVYLIYSVSFCSMAK